ncbi:glycosyltransferase [Pseudonocardia sp. WMMC193]|uniref:MGDG synthase family glycosyltransferase n=1 Tax=Pseudonocardia sp. WMMC193 TaxID=2911965 RepID=UPI001F2F04C6|nr:glycosyltransferase [Pseudonocardia sp. WMMC193]MCF7552175.1 hypothetical protein [Pseudonocardia sp. WMMC193]
MMSRIILVYSRAGGGHAAVADAIADELAANEATNRPLVEKVDLFDVSLNRLLGSLPALYRWLSARFVLPYNLAYRLTNTRLTSGVISSLLSLIAGRAICQKFRFQHGDVLVVVAPFAAQILALIRRRGRVNFRLAVVVTDLVSIHASWFANSLDAYIAATPEAKLRLAQLGAPEARLHLVTYPVRSLFRADPFTLPNSGNRLEAPSISYLVLGGGAGAGPIEETVRWLVDRYPRAEVVVASGDNSRLRMRLHRLFEGDSVTVLPKVEDLSGYMRRASFIISKAGPATIMEAASLGRPLGLTAERGMQEVGNIDWAVKNGLAVRLDACERAAYDRSADGVILGAAAALPAPQRPPIHSRECAGAVVWGLASPSSD